ncbi:MAG: ABC transporter substrate-binding protein [Lachnospiraceae bacterium]
MKKKLALALASLLCVSLFAGCGNSATTETTDPAATETTETDATETETTEAEAETTEVAEFTTVKDGVLTMATNAYFPPYEYYEGDAIVGIDAEIAAAIADKLGLTLEIQDMEFGAILTAVQSGKVDMGLAGMTVTEERLQTVNFSTSYATGIQSIIVTEDSEIASVDDLAGHMIGVQLSTTGDIYAVDDFGQEFVEEYNKGADAVLALINGKVDAVIIDNQPALSFVAANEGLKILDTEYVTEDYAACVSKDNEALLTAINQALDELIADGTIQAILDKYITAE